jgi:hypothetical protein
MVTEDMVTVVLPKHKVVKGRWTVLCGMISAKTLKDSKGPPGIQRVILLREVAAGFIVARAPIASSAHALSEHMSLNHTLIDLRRGTLECTVLSSKGCHVHVLRLKPEYVVHQECALLKTSFSCSEE